MWNAWISHGGFKIQNNPHKPILIYNKERTAMLTHDDQELGVESREGGLQRVAGVEIIESRHTISPESAQLVLAGSPGLRLGNIHQKLWEEKEEKERPLYAGVY